MLLATAYTHPFGLSPTPSYPPLGIPFCSSFYRHKKGPRLYMPLIKDNNNVTHGASGHHLMPTHLSRMALKAAMVAYGVPVKGSRYLQLEGV